MNSSHSPVKAIRIPNKEVPGMICPICGCGKSRIYDSGTHDSEKVETTTIRRRECTECLTRWVTEEKLLRLIPSEAGKHTPKKYK